jgi:hypothetical protein
MRATILFLVVGTALAQTPTPRVPVAKDGAGKIPPVLRKPATSTSKIGTFNATKLAELMARTSFLTKQLNQSIIAAERYAHTSQDMELQKRTHARFAAYIQGLQSQWHKMSTEEHVTDAGYPLAAMTAAKGLSSAAKMATTLPKMGTPGSMVPHATVTKSTMKGTNSIVNKLAPSAKPTPKGSKPAPKPAPTAPKSGFSLFGR